MKVRNSARLRAEVESLEQRIAMAGNVSVSFSGIGSSRDLVIIGDNSANDFEIVSTGVIDKFVIKGRNNTKINGNLNGSFFFDNYNFSDDIVIDLKGGNDILSMRGADSGFGDLDAWNDLDIRMGDGNDKLELKFVQAGGQGLLDSDILINTGKGADTVTIRSVDVQDDLRVVNDNSSQSSSTKVRADLYDSYVSGTLEVDFYYSTGVVNMTGINTGVLDVELHSGNDRLNVKRSRARGSFRLDGGSGTDDLNFYSNSTSFSGVDFKTATRYNTWYS